MGKAEDIKSRIDSRTNARAEYEKRVASRDTVLDIGGVNQQSRSNRRLRELSSNPNTRIVSTDIIADYCPDIVDDICNSKIEENSYDAVNCDGILEHVTDYEAAIRNIHRILKPGGEVFVYVPFFWCFHDKMDYHRFTHWELDRILGIFREHRLFLPDVNGYGGVLWQILTFHQIYKHPKLWGLLSRLTNALLAGYFTLRFIPEWVRGRKGQRRSFRYYIFYCIHLSVNHGFCAWAVK
jgi:SAM-dependent methyltransferase